MKKVAVSCALLVITPSDKILVVHPTNAGYYGCWSLPKGIKDEDESAAMAAARECFEESGLDFCDKIDEFVDLGRHSYVTGKDIHIFVYKSETDLEGTLFECTTHFTDRKGNQVVEVDKHELVDLDSALRMLNSKQAKLVSKALEG